MRKITLTVNGQAIRVNYGETLVDAALRGRVVIPHDCCAGQCDTCRVQVLHGEVDALGTGRGNSVQACIARVEEDAEICFDEVPALTTQRGEVSAIRPLSPEIYELFVRMPKAFDYLPGQYVSLEFNGFPARDYSPTLFEDGTQDPRTLVFHLKKYPDGLVSSQLNQRITIGTKVKVKGPYGHAFYRESEGRLILIASGTGFAPIFAVAREALRVSPTRDIHLIAGTQNATNLYMAAALLALRGQGLKKVTLSASQQGYGGMVKKGRPTAFLPALEASDTLYAAGVPDMVDAVTKLALRANATIYADPFTINPKGLSLYNRLQAMMQAQSPRDLASILSPRPFGKPTFHVQAAHPRLETRPTATKITRRVETGREEGRKVINR